MLFQVGHKTNVGRKLSEETKRKISEANKGKTCKPHTNEAKEKIGAYWRGRKRSVENRERLRFGNLLPNFAKRNLEQKKEWLTPTQVIKMGIGLKTEVN